MSRLDGLERLNELRANGTLSYDEFLVEKARLLERNDRANAKKWSLPQGAFKGRRTRWSLITTLVAFPLAILGIHELRRSNGASGNPAAVLDTSGSAAEDDATGSSEWSVASQTDAMTDVASKVASASFPGDLGHVEMEITCDSAGAVKYEAAAYDKDDKPLNMQTGMVGAAEYIPYDFRLDSDPPIDGKMINPRYDNVIDLDTNYVSMVANPKPVVSAQKITLRLHLSTGDQTIAINQTDPALASTLAPCVSAAQAKSAKIQAARDAEAAQPATPSTTTTTTAM